jgi:hypothetical protein
MRSLDLALALLFTVVISGVCFSADITVRLVKIGNGQPAKGETIKLFLGDPGRPSTPFLKATTSVDGNAIFHLPDPLPSQVGVYSENGHIRDCSEPFLFRTPDVLEHGTVAKIEDRPGRRDKRNAKLSGGVAAKPGELVVFVRPLRWWERGLN